MDEPLIGLGLAELRLHRYPKFDALTYDEQRRYLGLPDVGKVTLDPSPADARYPTRTYDRQGRPMSFEVWMQVCANFEYKVIEKTYLVVDGKDVEVSTVWLGLDHAMPMFGETTPIIFETMVFGEFGGEDMSNDLQWRYCTEEEARDGHAQAVAACNRLASIEPDPEQGELA